jgi:uncharacterized membrane protein|tara:strand:- start:203 stop:406 length:204 start_codon:yes stop_codon:yes gene_type:complete
MDTNKRSIVKALTWRALASLATFTISYIVTGSIAAATGIASVQVFVNLFLYYIHERIWNKIDWGQNV